MKNRYIAAALAFFLGGLGAHKFYLGKWIGIIYLLFCWTYIPSIIALIEGILYLVNGEEDFNRKYNCRIKTSRPDSYISFNPPINTSSTPRSSDTTDTDIVCPQCGHINEAGSNFCESCGQKL